MDHPTGAEPQPGPREDDAYGRAALLLVESLIHGLTAQSTLSVSDAVSIMEIAVDAQVAAVEDAAVPSASMKKAMALLSTMLESMRIDLKK